MLKNIVSWFAGKKTYFVITCTLLYAVYGYYKGFLSSEEFVQLVSTALIGGGIRNSVSKSK